MTNEFKKCLWLFPFNGPISFLNNLNLDEILILFILACRENGNFMTRILTSPDSNTAYYTFSLLTFPLAENCLPVKELMGMNCQSGKYQLWRGWRETLKYLEVIGQVSTSHHRDWSTEFFLVLEGQERREPRELWEMRMWRA